jgi:PAS domain S-box-containing protein
MPTEFTDAAQSDGLLRWIDEFAQQGIFTTDRDLIVRSWNRWLETATGRSAATIVGRPILEALPELAERGFEPYYRAALDGEIKVLAHAFHRYLIAPPVAPGRDIRQSGRIAPLMSNGAIVGTVTVIEDVTERVASERELRNQFEASESARGLAEEAVRVKDEFLTILSHEIRTPLNAVLGWTRILLARATSPDMLQRALEIIDRNAMSQVRLIDDMLDTARIMSGKLRLEPQVVDLGRVVMAAFDVVAPTAAAKGVRLDAEIGEAPVSMLGDPDRLQQIVWNLLANAIKFTESGGQVTVGVSSTPGALTLTVTDNGEGIPATFLPQLFERFRQADASSSRRHGGLGIGLSLVRQLVELHGGRITARSTEGEGSTFVVTFPSRPDLVAASLEGNDEVTTLEHVHVLVVDHEDDGRELLVMALEQHGARVTALAREADALSFLERVERHERPHAIVADVRGGADVGLSLVQALQRSPVVGGPIPAIAIISRDHPVERERVHTAGFYAHLSKPLSPRALARTVRSVVGRA